MRIQVVHGRKCVCVCVCVCVREREREREGGRGGEGGGEGEGEAEREGEGGETTPRIDPRAPHKLGKNSIPYLPTQPRKNSFKKNKPL